MHFNVSNEHIIYDPNEEFMYSCPRGGAAQGRLQVLAYSDVHGFDDYARDLSIASSMYDKLWG